MHVFFLGGGVYIPPWVRPWSYNRDLHCIAANKGHRLKLGSHYPCPLAVSTANGHGPWTRASKMTQVSTSRGLPMDTGVKNDTRVHGPCWPSVYRPSSVYRVHLHGPCPRPASCQLAPKVTRVRDVGYRTVPGYD